MEQFANDLARIFHFWFVSAANRGQAQSALAIIATMPLTLKQFVENVSQSGLMEAGEVNSFCENLPPERRDSVQDLAKLLVRERKLTKYQAQIIYQGKHQGLKFGEYTILDKLGEGGMGVVLRARHGRMEREVAIKVLPAKSLTNQQAIDRFYREVRAAAKLIHPNIVTAFDASEHAGSHYLVLEFVDGKDLSQILSESGRLPVAQAIECTIQAARGLEYAHSEGADSSRYQAREPVARQRWHRKDFGLGPGSPRTGKRFA